MPGNTPTPNTILHTEASHGFGGQEIRIQRLYALDCAMERVTRLYRELLGP